VEGGGCHFLRTVARFATPLVSVVGQTLEALR